MQFDEPMVRTLLAWWTREEGVKGVETLLGDDFEFVLNGIRSSREEFLLTVRHAGKQQQVGELVTVVGPWQTAAFFETIDMVTMLRHVHSWLVSHRNGRIERIRAVFATVLEGGDLARAP